MRRLDAEYYFDEARKCEAAAAKARDLATKELLARVCTVLANSSEPSPHRDRIQPKPERAAIVAGLASRGLFCAKGFSLLFRNQR